MSHTQFSSDLIATMIKELESIGYQINKIDAEKVPDSDKFEVGKWYILDSEYLDTYKIFRVKKISETEIAIDNSSSDILIDGFLKKSIYYQDAVLASEDQIKNHLITLAREKYKNVSVVDHIDGGGYFTRLDVENPEAGNEFSYNMEKDSLWAGTTLYEKGIWASVHKKSIWEYTELYSDIEKVNYKTQLDKQNIGQLTSYAILLDAYKRFIKESDVNRSIHGSRLPWVPGWVENMEFIAGYQLTDNFSPFRFNTVEVLNNFFALTDATELFKSYLEIK